VIRVLHVVGGLGVGGVEQWLVQVMREADRERFHFDFLVHHDDDGIHLAPARALGAGVLVDHLAVKPSGDISRIVDAGQYVSRLRQILRVGKYDVVHTHQHHFSSLAVFAAFHASVPVRIVHSHIDTSPVDQRASLARRSYLSAARSMILRYSTGGLAANERAALSLFGRQWRKNCRILYYGTDLRRFVACSDQTEYRRALGIPAGAWVVGHVGRFVEQKNHRFLLKIAVELAAIEPRFHLLLIGDGPLHAEVVDLARKAGLSDRVTFLGTRRDVPPLMLNAMDAYLMPSLYEGLPIALVEAQAAGLPCLISTSVSPASEAVPSLFRQLSLDVSPATWAAELQKLRPLADRAVALQQVEAGPFNIRNSARAVTSYYDEQLSRVGVPHQRQHTVGT
jgi:glycosyltransferase involved in cell wall biosynthesis